MNDGFYECDAIAQTVATHGEYDGDGEDFDDMMMLVTTMPDGDGEDVEDDAASIFTIFYV